jgi:hypothetical protein
MPYFHATWRRHLPSIQEHGLGGAAPDAQNFPVERGVYLAVDAAIALSMLLDAYLVNGEDSGLTPPEALAAMCVIVIDDTRIRPQLLDIDPNVARRDVTALYRGVVDVTGMPVLSVDSVIRKDAMTVDEAKKTLGVQSKPPF